MTTPAEPSETASRSQPRSPSPSVSAVVDGGRRRLDDLFGTHSAAVWAFARRRSSATVADDVVSDTFLVAWRRLDDVPDHALPWLLGVARRVLANRRRADARQSALHHRIETSGPLVHQHAESGPSSGTDAISAALAALPPVEHEAITLLAWEGLTPAEAAAVAGCSRATFYVRVHRARRRLTDAIAERSPATTAPATIAPATTAPATTASTTGEPT